MFTDHTITLTGIPEAFREWLSHCLRGSCGRPGLIAKVADSCSSVASQSISPAGSNDLAQIIEIVDKEVRRHWPARDIELDCGHSWHDTIKFCGIHG